jgi:excisionase family DNA binding protein
MTSTDDAHRYLAPGEVAYLLNVSRQSVYRAIDRGSLPAIRLAPHGALRIPESALRPSPTEKATK